MYNICLGLIFSSVVNEIFFRLALSLSLHGRCWSVSLYIANSSSDWWVHLIFAEMPLSCMPVFLLIFFTLKMLPFLCRTHTARRHCVSLYLRHILYFARSPCLCVFLIFGHFLRWLMSCFHFLFTFVSHACDCVCIHIWTSKLADWKSVHLSTLFDNIEEKKKRTQEHSTNQTHNKNI